MAGQSLYLTRPEPHLKGARGPLAAPGWRLEVALGHSEEALGQGEGAGPREKVLG